MQAYYAKGGKIARIITNKNNKTALLQFVTFSVSYKKTTINWQKIKLTAVGLVTGTEKVDNFM